MDGNARWAARRGLSTFLGHQAGLQAFKKLLRLCNDWRVPALTVFAFSSENWTRGPDEVTFLMELFSQALRSEGEAMHDAGIRLRVVGSREKLPGHLRDEVLRMERLTASNTGMQLNVALSFSGKGDIAAAAKAIARLAAAGKLDPESVDESMVESHLALAPVLESVGPPDLLVRTSGEQRLSNFLLWELAYTEIVFQNVEWPDYGERQLVEAVAEFQGRKRRFGGRREGGT